MGALIGPPDTGREGACAGSARARQGQRTRRPLSSPTSRSAGPTGTELAHRTMGGRENAPRHIGISLSPCREVNIRQSPGTCSDEMEHTQVLMGASPNDKRGQSPSRQAASNATNGCLELQSRAGGSKAPRHVGQPLRLAVRFVVTALDVTGNTTPRRYRDPVVRRPAPDRLRIAARLG